VTEAHNRLSELLDEALRGTDVVIARRGVPIVRLTPVDASTRSSNGAALAAFLAERWERRGGTPEDELADHIRAERAAWE
jgi:prevent-host-death family protein